MKYSETDPAVNAEASALPLERDEVCSVATVRRIAAMLDLEPDEHVAGTALPRGWHFMLLAADTRRSVLRRDGFPGLGVPMPDDLGLPRLMLGGRKVSFHTDIPIGASVTRRSAVRSIARKTTASGPMAVVTLEHELRVEQQADAAVVETQTYLLLPARPEGGAAQASEAAAPVIPVTPANPALSTHIKTVVPDDTMLFQYCALGFNSHRIHWDREHARTVEGFPDLVVNGGLVTLLLTEFLRSDLRETPAAIAVRHIAPLYAGRPITMTADRVGERWRLLAYDDHHHVAVDMEVTYR